MKFMTLVLATALSFAGCASVAWADEETTTTTTTTETMETTSVLPTTYVVSASESYMVVDANGVLMGAYDPVTRMFDGHRMVSGLYLIEKSNGRVVATVDASGNLIAFSSMPATLPAHFVVVNGSLVYAANNYNFRRAEFEQRISDEYAEGRLTHNQVLKLRDELAKIASLETRTRSDGTLSLSRSQDIERRFSRVADDLSRYVADTNTKRARIGLRVD